MGSLASLRHCESFGKARWARAFTYRQWTLGCSAGIEQSEDMKRFLWDNHFAAIASDQPSLEVILCHRRHDVSREPG